jgi:hypothetical protein
LNALRGFFLRSEGRRDPFRGGSSALSSCDASQLPLPAKEKICGMFDWVVHQPRCGRQRRCWILSIAGRITIARLDSCYCDDGGTVRGSVLHRMQPSINVMRACSGSASRLRRPRPLDEFALDSVCSARGERFIAQLLVCSHVLPTARLSSFDM